MDITEYQPNDNLDMNHYQEAQRPRSAKVQLDRQMRSRPISAQHPNAKFRQQQPEIPRPPAHQGGPSGQFQSPTGSNNRIAYDLRKIPKNIPNDKERLYESTLHLKNEINFLKEDNAKLKGRNLQMEREINKLSRMVEDSGGHGLPYQVAGKQTESAMVESLKKTCKQIKTDLTAREEELNTLKKTLKFTKVNELEIENKNFAEELMRLKAVLENTLRQKADIIMRNEDFNILEEKYYAQNNMIESLRKDNTELASAIKMIQEDMNTMQAQKNKSEQNIHRLNGEIQRLNRVIRDKDKDMEEQRNQMLTLFPSHKGAGGHHETNPAAELIKKNDQIRQLEKQIAELKVKASIGGPTSAPSDQNELKKLREENEELRRRLEGNSNGNNELRVNVSQEKTSNRPLSAAVNQRPTTAAAPVKEEDAAAIAWPMSIRLKAAGVSMEEAERMLFAERKKGAGVNSADVEETIKGEPFSVREDKSAQSLVQFIFDKAGADKSSGDVGSLKKAFRPLVGHYQLLSETESRAADEAVKKSVTKYQVSLRELLKMRQKKGCVDHKTLRSAFKDLEIKLNEDQFEYILIRMLSAGNNTLEALNVDTLFQFFISTAPMRESQKGIKDEYDDEEYEVIGDEDEEYLNDDI